MRLEFDAVKRQIHGTEHANDCGPQTVELPLDAQVIAFVTLGLQSSQRVFEAAAPPLAVPQAASQVVVYLGATEKVFKRLGREPAAPVSAEPCAGQQYLCHGTSLPISRTS